MEKHLKRQLREIVGAEHVTDAKEDLVCYAYDATGEQHLPEAILYPGNASEVSAILKLANIRRIPVVPRGAGSGFSGGALAVQGGLILAMNRLDRILSIDPENLVAEVEPAVVTARFQSAVEKVGLFYPPDPASHTFSTLGGNIAENAGGMCAVKYGVTKDYVRGLEVVLPTGEMVHTGSACAKDVVGYDLTTLFVGSEGTLGVVTKATLRLLPLPEARQTLTATFGTMAAAATTVSGIIAAGIVPATLEFLDGASLRAVERHARLGFPTSAEAFLLIEVDGDADCIDGPLQRVQEICRENGALAVNIARETAEQEKLWRARRAVSPALRAISRYRMNEDIVVPRSKIPEMIARIRATGEKHGIPIVNFGHAGDGNIHVTVMAGAGEEADLPKMKKAVADIFSDTVALGGRISGEHGIGLSKQPYIGLNLDGPTLALCRRLKKTLDPNNVLNPGKMFP
ncbi:MAG: FAD-linked oxidase C-terminal domain-containing protein [Desulfobacterales bacterium]|jgi:glycolate oxidase